MKSLIIILGFLISSHSLAETMNVRGVDEIKIVRTNGIGAEYFMQSADTGRIYKYRVDSITEKSGYLEVNFVRADDFFYITYEEIPLSSAPATHANSLGDQTQTKDEFHYRPTDTANRSVGIESAGAAAATYLLVTNSKAVRQLEKIYKETAEIYKRIYEQQEYILNAQNSVTNAAYDLNEKIRTKAPAQIHTPVKNFSKADLISLHIQANSDLEHMKWLSQDREFTEPADRVRHTLLQSNPKGRVHTKYFDISKEALLRADANYFVGEKDSAQFLLQVAQTAADVLVGLDPLTGTARSLYETVIGENLITGATLSNGERVIAALGVLTAGYVLEAWKIYKHLLPIAKKLAPKAIQTFYAIQKFLNKTGNGFELVGKGTPVRRIHLKSPVDPKWGVSPYHLNRHFRGSGVLSLKIIDPAGNTDIWMKNIADLAQRPISYYKQGGIIDVYHYYQKADQTGFYRLGLRLNPRADGTFDLVTVLTDQKRILK